MATQKNPSAARDSERGNYGNVPNPHFIPIVIFGGIATAIFGLAGLIASAAVAIAAPFVARRSR